MNAWMHGCMTAWMHERMSAWMYAVMQSCIHTFIDIPISILLRSSFLILSSYSY